MHDTAPAPPYVSVILPVYNAGRYISAALESLLRQSFKDFELIAFDDGSTDESLQILQQFAAKDARLRVFSRPNQGVAHTLAEAMQQARGTLIARMDADDISLPERLAVQCAFFARHAQAVAVGSAATFIDQDGAAICNYFPHEDDDTLRGRLPESPFISPSVMFRKDAYFQAGGYPAHMNLGGEDVILYGRLAAKGKLYNLPNVLIHYRLVPGSLSRKPAHFRQMLQALIVQELQGQPATETQLQTLRQTVQHAPVQHSHHDYALEIAKLCLWSGSQRQQAVRHLLPCLASRTHAAKAGVLLLLTLLPQSWVRSLYTRRKHRHYRPC